MCNSIFQTKKMIVVSTSISQLHIIEEACRRNAQLTSTNIFEYSGRSNTFSKGLATENAITAFARAAPGAILLLSAKAGGAGINLHYASHVIICEPF